MGSSTLITRRKQPGGSRGFGNMAILEIMDFRLKQGANRGKYLKESDRILREFTSKQPGFITAKLGEAKGGEFTWIIEWEGRRHAEATARAFRRREKDMAVFKKFIDEKSVRTRYTIVAGEWRR